MKKKKFEFWKIVVSSIICASIVLIIVAICLLRKHTVPESVDTLTYECKWIMEYNEKGNLLSKNLYFGKGSESAYILEYHYDEEGNRIQRIYIDLIDEDMESPEVSTFEYNNGKMVAKEIDGVTYKLSEKENYIYVITENENQTKYRFETEPDEKITAIKRGDSKYASVRYNYSKFGKLQSILDRGNKFSYEYDLLGRYYEICCDFMSDNNELKAEFVYEDKENYTAYVYNEKEELIKKYVYKCDSNGNLIEVTIFNNGSIKSVDWGGNREVTSYNYPGGEVMENLLEY